MCDDVKMGDTTPSVRLMKECRIVCIWTIWTVGFECDMYLQYYRKIPCCMFSMINPPRQGHSSLVFDSENVSFRDIFRSLYLDLIETRLFLLLENDLNRP